jgi:hypothetical protein
VTSIGIGLLIEEHRGEIAAAWRQAAAAIGDPEPAMGYAVAPLLRELSVSLRDPGAATRTREAWGRCAVLIRSSARPAQIAREVKALHEAIWGALRTSGQPVMPDERSAVDAWLFEALAEFLERAERTRERLDVLEVPASGARPAGAGAGAAARAETESEAGPVAGTSTGTGAGPRSDSSTGSRAGPPPLPARDGARGPPPLPTRH